jgi:hypothetical protein
MFILRLAAALDQAKVDYALVGGYAVALHGAVRGTIDVDLAIHFTESSFVAAEKALQKLGLEPRLPVRAKEVFAFRKEYVANRNLIAWSFYNPKAPIEIVDVLLTEDALKIQSVPIKVGKQTLKVASIPDLIRMKKASGRAQDLADVDALSRILKGASRK